MTRRQLMRSAGGMALASFALPPNLRKLIDNARRGGLFRAGSPPH